MNAEITVTRHGANGFVHEIVVEVSVGALGVFSANAKEDVSEKRFSRRYDPEGEWLDTGNFEFQRRYQFPLTQREKEHAMDALLQASREVHRSFQQLREQLAA